MATDPRIGQRIKRRRQELGLTQKDLAERVGVDPSSVVNWEKGRHFPARYQGAVEAALGISLTEDDEPDPGPQDGDGYDRLERRALDLLKEIERQRRQGRQGGDSNAEVRRYGT